MKKNRFSNRRLHLEPLEPRIAPSVLIVNPTTARYTDVDGDIVTIKVSAGHLSDANFISAAAGKGDQLQTIDLSAGGFAGVNLSVTVARVTGGDGEANIGCLDSTGYDLGKVSIPGDLGHFNAGDDNFTTPGLKEISVASLCKMGSATQTDDASYVSAVHGSLGALKVRGDISGGFVVVSNGGIGSVSVGGSLMGDSWENSGAILSMSDIGPVTIGVDVAGSQGKYSGSISSGGKLGNVTIGGSLFGGPGEGSGVIVANYNLGNVKIGVDMRGGTGTHSGFVSSSYGGIASVSIGRSLIGGFAGNAETDYTGEIFAGGNIGSIKIGRDFISGTGVKSGVINCQGNIGPITIGGSVIGGTGDNSGNIFANGSIGKLYVGHDIQGSDGNNSGVITAYSGGIASVTIGGSVIGGAGDSSGEVYANGNIGKVSIGHDVIGGSGNTSGIINASAGSIASITIGGSVIGGVRDNSGEVFANSNIGKVSIGHDVIGGSGNTSGIINASAGSISSLSVGGSLIGGSGINSGMLLAGASMGKVSIAHDMIGGSAESSSGVIESYAGGIAGVSIGGSVFGGSGKFSSFIAAGTSGAYGNFSLGSLTIGGSLVGGEGDHSASVMAKSSIGPVKIAGDIRGNGPSSALIFTWLGNISSVAVGGSIVSGTSAYSGMIQAQDHLGPLVVKGSIIGDSQNPVWITAGAYTLSGPSANLGIASVSVGGRVMYAQILAGYGMQTVGDQQSLAPLSGHVQIGAVKVGGDWVLSNLVAGVQNIGARTNIFFGDANDSLIDAGNESIISKIASIVVGGQAYGTPNSSSSTDHYGFTAQQIGSLKIAGWNIGLRSGAHNDDQLLSGQSDVSVHEI